ncbi:MAG: hypothetical protein HND48_25170 [Chloroflexi bacterium]|nr:hypothetical protein [Chloroflexota bacterium]
MSAQIPNYGEFAKLPLAQRKMILGMAARFGGDQLAPLFMAVYQQDPDPELRELARKELAEAGITVQGEGDRSIRRRHRHSRDRRWAGSASAGLRPAMRSASRRTRSGGGSWPITGPISRPRATRMA